MNEEDYIEVDSDEYEYCPKCDRWYDEVDFIFQSCHWCGWDVAKNRHIKITATDVL